MRLLLIEDELDMAQALARGLQQQGYAVDIATDGKQGWELATIHRLLKCDGKKTALKDGLGQRSNPTQTQLPNLTFARSERCFLWLCLAA